MKKQLVLASASPRRKELLDQIGVSYYVCPVDIDEIPYLLESPTDYVCRVTAEKAKVCFSEIGDALPILAADTTVVINGKILGKPREQEHANSMLTLLSGNIHQVLTAISLICLDKNGEKQHFQLLSTTDVCFRKIGSKEIAAYWETGEPEGKAGGYAIQGLASIFVKSINGSFSGVMGLPLFETAKLLSKQGIKVIT